ncbi:Hpt domain-containing protein [Sulfurovum mangrovi]|uniref:Hpt domain-containing protein n=1 Tax=Sulfurovum mangrovi TaxID=2893889 RepID=UPI001E490B26|nr:Hpt domain-containing protein [Sulfurovum mangrovi]UFH60285.1 Hpt domain-containing protein [Sulfurovum mangrovi]
MFGTVLLIIIVLGIGGVIYFEYKSAQKYKKEREEKRKQRKESAPSRVGPVKTVKKEEEPKPKAESKSKSEPKPKPEPVEEKAVVTEEVTAKPEPVIVKEEAEEEVPEKELPACNYPPFDHSRTVESLGLSDEDAKEFVGELISQLDSHLPLIAKEVEAGNFHALEQLTHSVKGSATNLGIGGVADLLTDFNTYLKEGKDVDVVKSYYACLETYTQKLKEQYA